MKSYVSYEMTSESYKISLGLCPLDSEVTGIAPCTDDWTRGPNLPNEVVRLASGGQSDVTLGRSETKIRTSSFGSLSSRYTSRGSVT